MAIFCYRSTVKGILGIPDSVTTYDSAIDVLLDVADQMVLDEIDLEAAVSTTYSEKIDIDFGGQNEVLLSRTPVISIVGLTINGQAQTLDTDYYLVKNVGAIKLDPLSASFPTGRNVVDVTYTAGYQNASAIPKDLVHAANLIAASIFNQQSHFGLKSERAGGYSYQMDSGTGSTIPKIAQRILNKHRRLFARGMRG